MWCRYGSRSNYKPYARGGCSLTTFLLFRRYPRGQRERTVNLPALAFGGSNASPPDYELKFLIGDKVMLENEFLKRQAELYSQPVKGLQLAPSTPFNLSVRKVNLGYICHIENLYPDGTGTYVFPNKKELMKGIELLIPDIDNE